MDHAPSDRSVQLLKRHPIIFASTPLVIALAIQAVLKVPSEWLEVFVPAARTFWAGRDIYGSFGYLYPPFMALALVPFAPLPAIASRLIWFAINIACSVGLVRSAWMLAGGSSLGPVSAARRPEWKIAAIGILCAAPYALNTLAHQQVDLAISFLIAAGCLALVRHNRIGGAVLIGLAAACKGPPLLFAGYLIFRRNWLAAALLILVAIGANLLPDLIVPPPDGRPRLLAWFDRFALPAFSGQLGAWNGIGVYNQSLAGTAQRLLATTLHATSADPVIVPRAAAIPEVAIKLTTYGIMLALLLASMFAALRNAAPATAARFPSRTAWELAAMSILVLLMSPMTDLAHLPILIMPAFCLARIAAATRDRVIWGTVLIAMAGALITHKDLVGGANYTAMLWSGIATWSMLALWLGCVWALARGYGGAPAARFGKSIFSLFATERVGRQDQPPPVQ